MWIRFLFVVSFLQSRAEDVCNSKVCWRLFSILLFFYYILTTDVLIYTVFSDELLFCFVMLWMYWCVCCVCLVVLLCFCLFFCVLFFCFSLFFLVCCFFFLRLGPFSCSSLFHYPDLLSSPIRRFSELPVSIISRLLLFAPLRSPHGV